LLPSHLLLSKPYPTLAFAAGQQGQGKSCAQAKGKSLQAKGQKHVKHVK